MPSARTAPAAPRRHARTPPRPRRLKVLRVPAHKVRWDRVGRVALLVVFAVVGLLYGRQAISYLSVRSQANQQDAIVKRLKSENAGLQRQAKSLSNPATIVRDARALGMVKPGERPYVVTGLPQH
jgi:cell division protein FtsB